MRHGQQRRQRRAGVDYIVGEWCPELVGKVPGYPRTQETYEAQRARLNANRERALRAGTLTRHGVPNGWAGKKEELAEIRRNSQEGAERLIGRMAAKGVFVPDNWQAELAMTAAVAMVLNKAYSTMTRMRAVRVILEYSQVKPTVRPVRKNAEYWLQGLADAANAIEPPTDT
jgi:hypothetical protein